MSAGLSSLVVATMSPRGTEPSSRGRHGGDGGPAVDGHGDGDRDRDAHVRDHDDRVRDHVDDAKPHPLSVCFLPSLSLSSPSSFFQAIRARARSPTTGSPPARNDPGHFRSRRRRRRRPRRRRSPIGRTAAPDDAIGSPLRPRRATGPPRRYWSITHGRDEGRRPRDGSRELRERFWDASTWVRPSTLTSRPSSFDYELCSRLVVMAVVGDRVLQ